MPVRVGKNAIGQLVADTGGIFRSPVVGDALDQTVVGRFNTRQILTHGLGISFELVVEGCIQLGHRVEDPPQRSLE